MRALDHLIPDRVMDLRWSSVSRYVPRFMVPMKSTQKLGLRSLLTVLVGLESFRTPFFAATSQEMGIQVPLRISGLWRQGEPITTSPYLPRK
jgi:hypothetical protein